MPDRPFRMTNPKGVLMTDTGIISHVPSIVVLDPNTVGVHPNVRHDLGDLTDLTRSIKAIGVRVPTVVVRGEDGDLQLVCGQRRRAAAIAAERPMPAIVSADLDEAERIVDQLAENQHRKDLTPTEEGRGYQLLADLGLSDTVIAKRTGVTRRRVEKARRVVGSDTASVLADECGLTLDQSLAAAEFDDDDAAKATLTETARQRPDQFDHVVSRLRQDRQREQEYAAAVEALNAAGVTVLHSSNEAPSATELWGLADGDGGGEHGGEDGGGITPEAHATCPGHAAKVSAHNPSNVTYYCLDPDAYGHRSLYRRTEARSTGGPMTDEQKADRKVVIENNKRWRAAVDVRLAYLRTLLARKKPPTGTLRFATEELMGAPGRVGVGSDSGLADLLGVERPTGWGHQVGRAQAEAAADSRLPLILLAQVAADREHTMNEHTWRRADEDAGRYFAFLASTGYALSDIEQLVVDSAAAEVERRKEFEARYQAEHQGEALHSEPDVTDEPDVPEDVEIGTAA